MSNKFKQLILLFGDIFFLYLSLYLTLIIRYQDVPGKKLWQDHLGPFSFIFIGWLLIFYIVNLYNLKKAVSNIQFFKTTLQAISVAAILSLTFFYLMPGTVIAPKTNLAIFIFIFSLLFIIWRNFFNWLLKSRIPKTSIAIIGYNEQVKKLLKELDTKPHLGYKLAFLIDYDKKYEIGKDNRITVFTTFDNLAELILEKKVNTIILTSNPEQSHNLRTALFNCLSLKIKYLSLPNFYEAITGKVPIEALNQMWFLENLNEGDKLWFDIFKRGYDIIIAFLILSLTLPLWPIIGLLIKLENKGPVLFKQLRAGKNNKIFTIFKFRTMTVNNNGFSPTIIDDSRITRIGNILRKVRIDEIPQVINILKGEMSFVGPRPERPELIKGLEKQIPFYNERTLVKPGVTGWDQISGEYHSPSYEDSMEKLQYDLFYIKNRSIYLDLSIILKTVATVLSREGR